jgi:small subunit ribosomal protein S11
MSDDMMTTKEVDANTASTKTATKDTVVEEAAVSTSKRGKKGGVRQIRKGQAHIHATYNNTIITITDLNGAVLGWSSSGSLGFKGAKKSTPFAASQIVNAVVEKVQKNNIKELQVFVKGVGGGRDAAIRALAAKGFDISLIKDLTPVAHNGCRARKPRRV